MNQDKLFNVTLLNANRDQILGIVKTEKMEDVMPYCRTNYPEYKIVSVEESVRQLL